LKLSQLQILIHKYNFTNPIHVGNLQAKKTLLWLGKASGRQRLRSVYVEIWKREMKDLIGFKFGGIRGKMRLSNQ